MGLRRLLAAAIPLLLCTLPTNADEGAATGASLASGASGWQVAGQQGQLVVRADGKEVLRYQLTRPADSKLPVDSACYFHPVMTPSGVVMTDVAPGDHKHHRGIFLAWVETHGKKDADFWGWGEPAPVKDRRIFNRGIGGSSASSSRGATFSVGNEWVAEGERVLTEELSVATTVAPAAKANVIDLTYTLTPEHDLTLSRWAFSGFCVRTRGDGKLTAYGPQGEVKLPNPSHVKPESDWPAAPWYGYTLAFDDGKVGGVAVVNHPDNPPALWHNHRDVRMLNPCIVAPAEVKLKAKQPLVLRYRVVVHDGQTPVEALNKLAAEWKGK